MEFNVNKSDLVRELSLSQGVVERKTTIPILSNVLLEASDGRLNLSATDLELSLRTSCAAEIVTPGSGTLPVKRLLDYVRLLPDAHVNIKFMENDWANLHCGRSRTKIAGMSKETYPELPETPPVIAELPAPLLATMISRTVFAISTEDSRFTLNGGLFQLTGDRLILVTTDGHRMALVRTAGPMADLGGVSYRTIIPRKAMGELVKLAQDLGENGVVEFSADDNHLFFRVGSRILISRKLTGTFPDYERVLPQDHSIRVETDRDQFRSALERVAQFADDRSHSIRLRVSPGELELFSSLSETGESEETVPGELEGEGVEIGFNATYVLDFLRAAPSERIAIRFRDGKSAGDFVPSGGDETLEYRYIVMPMKL